MLIDESDPRYEGYRKHKEEHGWSPCELWSLDTTIAQFILPRLKGLRKNSGGFPGSFSTFEEWEAILDKMIVSFEWHASDDKYLTAKEPDGIQEGLDLFAKYFGALWY